MDKSMSQIKFNIQGNYYQQLKYSLHRKKLEILFSFFYYALVHLLFSHKVMNPLHLKNIKTNALFIITKYGAGCERQIRH